MTSKTSRKKEIRGNLGMGPMNAHFSWKCATCPRRETESSWQNAMDSGKSHYIETGHAVMVESSRSLIIGHD